MMKIKTIRPRMWRVVAILFAYHLSLLTSFAQTTTFKYTASEKLPRFEEIQYFVGATGLVSHDWDEETGEGTVVYEGTVTEVGSYALQWQGKLTGIVIPEGVTRIGFQGFFQCSNLTNLTLPKSLKEIGVPSGQAFGGCSGLANGQFIIDDIAWWCSLTINGGSNPLTYAKKFYSAPDVEVTDLVIPEGVESICYNAFNGCTGITSVTLPSTLKSIGGNAFAYTTIETVNIPESVTEIEEYAFQHCGNLASVTIPEGVTTIGFSAFERTGVTELTLPSTIRSMSQSFYGCEKLAKLTLTDGITDLGGSFYSLPALKEVYVPGSVKKLQYSDFIRCENLETVTIAEGVEEVSGFNSCYNLKSVTIPSTASKVSGFSDCSNLTSVTCMAIEPPYMSNTIPYGKGMSMEGRTLYVPALNQSAYQEAKYWKEFPTVEGLDVLPENMLIRDELHVTVNSPLSTVNCKLLHDNDPKYGILTVDGDGSLKLSSFSLHMDPFMQCWKSDRALNYSSLINNATMEADNVSVELWIYSKVWTFVSLPFDVKVGEVEPFADGTTEWVIYTYDSRKRADGEMDATWVKMTADDVIKAGQGFIVQGQRKGADGRNKYDIALRFKAINNENKNNIFQTSDISVPLTIYDSEFPHNSNWNFIGNPYPCYFDMAQMDFRAPITVWNMSSKKYEAMRPGDDDYVICPGEGFFVQCPEDKNAIVFSKDGRQTTRERHAAARTRATDASRTIFNIMMNCGDNVDCTRIVINEAASAQYELDKDASKFFADDADMPHLYTEADGVSYAINERPLGDGTVTLCTTAGNGGLCTISLAKDVPDYDVTLEDPATGTTVALNGGQTHSFYGNGQTFLLHFNNTATAIRTIGTVPVVRNDVRYNLSGQRVTDTYKGLVITNGKKIIKN